MHGNGDVGSRDHWVGLWHMASLAMIHVERGPAARWKNMLAKQHGGQIPTIQHGGQIPAIQHGGQIPAIQHGGQIPTIQHGGQIPTISWLLISLVSMNHVLSSLICCTTRGFSLKKEQLFLCRTEKSLPAY